MNFAKMKINQDRVNEFQFRFHETNFRQYETEFCLKENDFCQIRKRFLCEIEFRYGGNEFRSCKIIDSRFGKVELHVGDFQFCSGGIHIHFGELQMEKV